MKTLRSIFKWLVIISIVGILCEISSGVVFILLAILVYKVFVKHESMKATLNSGVEKAGNLVNKMKD